MHGIQYRFHKLYHQIGSPRRPPSASEEMDKDGIKERHMTRLFDSFNEIREQGLLFDFTICVGSKKLRAHKLALAASSDYFKAMFSHNSKELLSGKVFLQNIDADAVEAIVDYIYKSEIRLDEENIQEVLLAASILQIRVIQDLCIKYIECQLDASNCLGVMALSERCDLLELTDKVWDYCCSKFNQVVNEREFTSIDDSLLSRLISDDKLNVDDETQVFQAVVKWIEADEEQRRPKLDQLMSHVRFALIEPVTLVNLTTIDLIQTSTGCRDMIDKAKNYLLLRGHPGLQEEHLGAILARQRFTRRRIFAVGGWTDEYRSIASAEVYDPKSDTWTEIAPMTQKRCGVGLTTLHNSIYAVGGHDGQTYLNSIERYDVNLSKWFKDVANMRYERSSVGVVTLNGYIYVIGGQINTSALNNVERYDPSSNSWIEVAPMIHSRLGVGVAVHDNFIYVMGGSEGGLIHDSVERYDPKMDTWTLLASMGTRRKHLGSCTCRNLIFAVGGRNNVASELDSAEVYDPQKDKWEYIPRMNRKRCGIGLVELLGLVYAIGGQNREARLSDVEAFDFETGSWHRRRSMQHARLGGGMVAYPPSRDN